MPSSLWLAIGDSNTHDAVNLMNPQGALVEAGGFLAPPPKIRTYHNRKKGNIYNEDPYRTLTLKLALAGPNPDAMWANYRAIEAKLEQAPRRTGPGKIGTGLTLWVILLGATDYVFFDILDGNLVRSFNRDTQGGATLYAELTLIARPFARGRPYTIAQSSTLTNGQATQFIGDVPGDTEALVQTYLRDKSTAGGINRLYAAVASHPTLTASEFSPIFGLLPAGAATYPADATAFAGATPHALVTSAFTDVGLYEHPGTGKQHGWTDLWARVRDGSTLTGSPTGFTAALDAAWDGVSKVYASNDVYQGVYIETVYFAAYGTTQNFPAFTSTQTVPHGAAAPVFYKQPGIVSSGTAVVGGTYTVTAPNNDVYYWFFQGLTGPLVQNVYNQVTISVSAVYSDGSVSAPSNYATFLEPNTPTTVHLTWLDVGSPTDHRVQFFTALTPPGPNGQDAVGSFLTGSATSPFAHTFPFTTINPVPLGIGDLLVTSGGSNPLQGSAAAANPSSIRAQVAVDCPNPIWQTGPPVVVPAPGNWYLLYLGRFQLPPKARNPDGSPTPWIVKVQAANPSTNVATTAVDADCILPFSSQGSQFFAEWPTLDNTDSNLGFKFDTRRDGLKGGRLTRYTFADGGGIVYDGQEAMLDVRGPLAFGPGGNVVGWFADREGGISDFVNTKFTVTYVVTPRYLFPKGVR